MWYENSLLRVIVLEEEGRVPLLIHIILNFSSWDVGRGSRTFEQAIDLMTVPADRVHCRVLT